MSGLNSETEITTFSLETATLGLTKTSFNYGVFFLWITIYTSIYTWYNIDYENIIII